MTTLRRNQNPHTRDLRQVAGKPGISQPVAMLTLKSVTVLALAFTVCIGLIRARPTRAGDLYTILASSGDCVLPCFMGIDPGTTTADEARAILAGHPWVDTVFEHRNTISWTWSGLQPAFIDADDEGVLYLVNRSVVQEIELQTAIPQIELWTALGAPRAGYVEYTPAAMAHHTAYDGFLAVTFTPCPAQPQDLWGMPVELHLGAAYRTPLITRSALINARVYLHTWRSNLICR
jgi:hypothetical protein